MKGEYVEEEFNNNNDNNNNDMFAKLSHQPKFQSPPHPPPHHFPPPHLLSRHPPFPDQPDPTTPTPPSQPPQPQDSHPPSKKPKTTTPPATQPTTSNEDNCGTIELSRRPRGRPPGSKNKPKPPIIITREPEPPMSPYILELPGGADIVDSLTRFTRRRGVGLCVLTATGAVANVTLKQPSTTTPGGTVTFHGRFDVLSLSAVVVVNTAPFHNGGGGFTISLAGPQGQIVGGKVVGALVCAGTVYITAASFNNPTFCRLPLDDHQNSQDQAPQSQPPPLPPNHHSNDDENSPVSGDPEGGSGGGTMTLYSGHVGPTTSGTAGEVIWATPTSVRPPY